jgi:hypothetical protein
MKMKLHDIPSTLIFEERKSSKKEGSHWPNQESKTSLMFMILKSPMTNTRAEQRADRQQQQQQQQQVLIRTQS